MAGTDSPLSLCMIVKNEEQFLAGCLESVQGLVGEIVVVDTGSLDNTVEIARQYGARIFHFEWIDDFAAARNFALQQTALDWVLYLDADERLPSRYHKQVLDKIQTGKFDALYVKVISQVSGILGNVTHEQSYPRIFRKLPGVCFEGRIHEQITPALKRCDARFGYLDVEIEHLGYCQNDDILRRKVERNLKYLEAQVESEPENAYAWFQYGQTLLLDGQKEKGKAGLQHALHLKTLPVNLTATILLIIANQHFEDKEYPQALIYTRQALQIAPNQRLGYFLQSECLAWQQNWDTAIDSLKRLRKNGSMAFSDISIDKNFPSYIISQRMA
ncbi:MAG: glycosyltransferase, partial [Calditrichia bacterium]